MKREIVFYSVASCVLIAFYVVYNGCLNCIQNTGCDVYYGNISEALYYCGFSAFFFINGYRVKDYGIKWNTLYIGSAIVAFSFVAGMFFSSGESWIDFTGIADGTWLVWFVPVLSVYLLTGIPASRYAVNMGWRYKTLIPLALVVLYIMGRLMFYGQLDYQAYHLGKILFFLPLFYLGYLYRLELENMPELKDYQRMTSWVGASFLAIISIILLRYYNFSFLGYHVVADALMQVACMGLVISTFASLKDRCKEMKIIYRGGVVVNSAIPVVVLIVLFYEMLLRQDLFVMEMSIHNVSIPFVSSVFLVSASYSIILIVAVLYKMAEGVFMDVKRNIQKIKLFVTSRF